MKRKFILPGIVIVLSILVTGCWNRRELNDIAIEVAIGIDKSGDQYRVTSQVVDPGEVAAKKGGDRTPVITFHATADSLFESRRKMTTLSSRKIYAAHVRIVVIGEELAREGIRGILDYLARDHEHRPDFFLVVAKGTSAENVLKIITPLEKIPANKLYSSLQTSERAWAPTTSVTLDELISDIVSKGKQPVLTGLEVKGEQEAGESKENAQKIDTPTQLKFSGIGVFKDDKLIGWLNEPESKGYNYLINNVKSTVGHISCPDGGKIVLEAIRSKTKVKANVKNGEPGIDIRIKMEVNVGEVQCGIDLMKPDTIAELEKKSEQRVISIVQQSIHKAQKEYGVDIFGFGEAMHRSHPKYWKEVEENWDREFADLPVQVKADVKVRRLGSVGESFLKKEKE
ncbi:Ger(x)C family spore germination protein [Paenibacillus caui]|uniref:Ger(x)C family spore germination protein n=1 Tax=Paenibacillus caui TaxID=2873927 RepID=UPI001CA868EB|nr:Ger(x)C family spore germination protein [Paenibacillus caui]